MRPWLSKIFNLLDDCFYYRGGGYGTKDGSVKAIKGARAGGSGGESSLPDGVDRDDSDIFGEDKIEYTFREGKNDVSVRFVGTGVAFDPVEITFDVNNDLDVSRRGGIGGENTIIANKVRQIVRHEARQRSNGTLFAGVPHQDDGRGLFRELSYARAGFSLANGGAQYATVKNGKLVPATASNKPLSASAIKKQQATIRNKMRQAIQEARDARS